MTSKQRQELTEKGFTAAGWKVVSVNNSDDKVYARTPKVVTQQSKRMSTNLKVTATKSKHNA